MGGGAEFLLFFKIRFLWELKQWVDQFKRGGILDTQLQNLEVATLVSIGLSGKLERYLTIWGDCQNARIISLITSG